MRFYGDAVRERLAAGSAFQPDINNITIKHIDEGRIAYLGIAMMLPFGRDENAAMADFFEAIVDYEHLIIDIRGNPGGNVAGFNRAITPRLIRRRAVSHYHIFINNSPRNVQFAQMMSRIDSGFNLRRFHIEGNSAIDSENLSVMLEGEHLRIDELEQFYYYFTHTTSVLVPPFGTTVFTGQVWLLTDSGTTSAAERVASLFQGQGIAILVGETTGGSIGNFDLAAMFFALPNSGIVFRSDPGYVVASDGRIPEEGIVPCFLNFDNMDALETTLALIREGAYRND